MLGHKISSIMAVNGIEWGPYTSNYWLMNDIDQLQRFKYPTLNPSQWNITIFRRFFLLFFLFNRLFLLLFPVRLCELLMFSWISTLFKSGLILLKLKYLKNASQSRGSKHILKKGTIRSFQCHAVRPSHLIAFKQCYCFSMCTMNVWLAHTYFIECVCVCV